MPVDLTKEYFDEQFESLTRAVKEGFDGTVTKVEFNDRMGRVETRLDGVETRLDGVETRLTRVEATMVTKSYLDDKLGDLKGDLITKMRKQDAKLDFIVDLLKGHSVLSDDDVRKIRTEYQIFPTMG